MDVGTPGRKYGAMNCVTRFSGGGLLLGMLFMISCSGEDESGDTARTASSGGASGAGTRGGSGGASTTGGSSGSGGTGGSGTAGKGSGGSNALGGTTGDAGAESGGRAGSSSGKGGSAGQGGGGKGGSSGRGGSGGTGIAETCEGVTELPAGAPELEVGRWVDITPPEIPKGDPENLIGQGLTMDPCNSAVLYWGTTPFESEYAGLYRSTDAGGSWTRLGTFGEVDENRSSFVDMPLRIRVNPNDPQHLYVGDGVRGDTLGFWISKDAGETWEKPLGLISLAEERGYFMDDIYDVAVDPTDFNHVIISFHSGWSDVLSSGVAESKDGGETWEAFEGPESWGSGHSIKFLYEPTQGIGDANTWLLGTQEDGYWRTTDGGENWTKVSSENIFHGGGSIYYSSEGVLYATAVTGLLRSTNNGESFTLVDLAGTTGIIGDGEMMYTGAAYALGAQPILVSPETDGENWTEFNSQTLEDGGPYEMVFDPVNRIIYSSNWFQGVWALKLED